MREKIHSYLGFSKRSRNLISGYNSCLYGIERGKVYLIILAEDLADNTLKKFNKLAADRNVPIYIFGTKDILSEMTGEQERGIFGITDEQLAAAIQAEIERIRQNGDKE